MNPNLAHEIEYLQQVFLSNAPIEDRLWAARNLVEFSTETGILFILQGLKEPSRTFQRAILEIFERVLVDSKLSNKEKLTPFIPKMEEFQQEPDWQIRITSLEILLHLNPPKQFDYLIKALNDPDVDIREFALKKLQNFGPKAHRYIVEALLDSRFKILALALDIAIQQEIEIPVLYLEKLRLRNELPIQVRFATYLNKAAEKHPNKYMEIVIRNLDSPIGYIQANTIETLVKLQNPILIPRLFSKLQHPEEEVVIKTMEAIVRLRESSLYPEIVRFLKDSRRTIRKTAVEMIGRIGETNLIPSILPLLADPFYEIREIVYDVLRRIKEIKAILPLLDRLKFGLDAEKTQIIQILDGYSFYELVLPLCQEVRNQTNIHPYIIEKLQSHFPSIAVIRNFQNLSIPFLISQLADPQYGFSAAILLQGWGYKALDPLKQKLSHIDPTDLNEKVIQLKITISELIERIESDHIMTVSDDYLLLL